VSGLVAHLARLDRALGRRAREAVARRPAAASALAVAANGMAPAFQAVVAAGCLGRGTRRRGLTALAAGVAAALLAREARDRIGRRRPGPRVQGGFPSRHAAAALAITTAVVDDDRRLGAALAGVAAVGLTGRVTDGQHDPADIVAGAALGVAVGLAARRVARGFPRGPARG
jgi:membrane-associated phospholipid phosphatase